jgi:hypothetical protein
MNSELLVLFFEGINRGTNNNVRPDEIVGGSNVAIVLRVICEVKEAQFDLCVYSPIAELSFQIEDCGVDGFTPI